MKAKPGAKPRKGNNWHVRDQVAISLEEFNAKLNNLDTKTDRQRRTVEAFREHKGNKNATAIALNVRKITVGQMMKKLGWENKYVLNLEGDSEALQVVEGVLVDHRGNEVDSPSQLFPRVLRSLHQCMVMGAKTLRWGLVKQIELHELYGNEKSGEDIAGWQKLNPELSVGKLAKLVESYTKNTTELLTKLVAVAATSADAERINAFMTAVLNFVRANRVHTCPHCKKESMTVKAEEVINIGKQNGMFG